MFLGVGYVLVMAYPGFEGEKTIKEDEKPIEVTLEFWGLWDNSDDWEEIIEKFESETYNFNGQKINVSINYSKKDFNSYEETLAKTKEKNSEPNIFMINNNWLEKYINQLEPLTGNDNYAEEYKLIKYEELLEIFSAETLRNLIYKNELYGLPTYSDSLALFYNKDLFLEAEIENPPLTWKEFKETAKKLTILDKNDEIVQSGASFGCGKNIDRSSDILSLLIIQGGAKMIDFDRNIDINKEIEINTVNGIEKRTPGERAVIFYTEFSDPEKETYIWDCEQEEAIKSFANGKTAMFIGYSYQIKNLLALNPDLDYAISKMPQLENSTIINFSNIWTPVVSKNNNCLVKPMELSDEIDCSKIAWSFLNFATREENSKIYLNSTGKAAARKDLLSEQIGSDNKINAFASQVETAINYNKFNDRIDGILVEMINETCLDRDDLNKIIDETVEEIKNLTVIARRPSERSEREGDAAIP
jgi:ABC-type glycerol-3-phosphate transport system substrate-binding protein